MPGVCPHESVSAAMWMSLARSAAPTSEMSRKLLATNKNRMKYKRIIFLIGALSQMDTGNGRKIRNPKLYLASLLTFHASRLFNDSIRPCQHVRRDRQRNLLGGYQVDDQFKLSRSLYRQVGRFRTLKDLIHIDRSAPILVGVSGS